MNLRTLIKRSLRYHWRSHLGVVTGAAIGSAALIGALIVGDSVKGSLRARALERLGWVEAAMDGGDRFFTKKLAEHTVPINRDAPETLTSWNYDAVLKLPATAARQDGTARASQVNLFGVGYWGFWQSTRLTHARPDFALIPKGSVVLNEALAAQLHAKPGDDILLRLHKPSALSRDTPITPKGEATLALKLKVHGIATAPYLGDFSLRLGQTPPLNAFLLINDLAPAVGLPGKANHILIGDFQTHQYSEPIWRQIWFRIEPHLPGYKPVSRAVRSTPTQLKNWRIEYRPSLADYSLDLPALTNPPALELRTERIFLDPAVVAAVFSTTNGGTTPQLPFWAMTWAAGPPNPTNQISHELIASLAQPMISYLVNLITVGSNAAPYSMVTAAGAPWTPPGLRDDEIVLNQWLADDLQVKPGDALTLVYFDPESGARLTERTNTFRVHSIVPMEMPWADRTLMPQFPGIEKAETTAEWDTAFPLVHKIRPQDDDYWTAHRGTPKAFVTLAAGQKMWANRFGNLTAIRFPLPTNFVATEVTRLHSAVQTNHASTLTPALSLRERENRPPTPGNTKVGDGSTASGKPESAQPLSPLPAGEGQGEGERVTPSNSIQASIAPSDRLKAELQAAETFRAALEKKILTRLKPEELGLRFEPVREQALKAAEQSQDFGGLFIGFSLFVIVAALLLMAMLFQFSLEQRTAEVGTLLALGFTPKQVRRLFLREGAALAFLGGIPGTLGGIGYARAMLHGLTTLWSDAVGGSALKFFVTTQTLVIGLLASTVVAVFTLWLALRKQARQPARVLLTGALECGDSSPLFQNTTKVKDSPATPKPTLLEQRGRVRALQGWLPLAAALGLIVWTLVKGDTANAGAFFGAGALVLLAGLVFVNARLRGLGSSRASTLTPALSLRERENRSPSSEKTQVGGNSTASGIPEEAQPLFPLPAGEGQSEGERAGLQQPSVSSLALRGLTRRRSRSVATVAMLASGTFLIVAIGVFRLDANRDATQRTSGTGGFALIGESTMPVVADLNTKAGRESFALNEANFADVDFVQFRVRAGDEASCLNLNRAQKPRLLGVKPQSLEGRFTFTTGTAWPSLRSSGRKSAPSEESAMDQSLVTSAAMNEIPAIGDAASIQWAMGKKVGDTLDYVDERGQLFKVRIVGAVANSILQGQLIIDEAEFVKRFPGESGYKYFLIDAPTNRVTDVSAKLSRALQDAGLELTPAPQRLAQFNAVQNTYLGTFQILGGLGLLLGSAGLGIVVLRNVLERRGELAVLLAVGWQRGAVNQLVLREHLTLLGLGLAIGLAAAAIAVLPSVLTPGAQFPWLTLSLTLAAVLANGLLWTWLAARLALRGDLLAALRND